MPERFRASTGVRIHVLHGLPVREDSRQAAVRKLQERARVLEGDLHIESTSESGTLLRLAVKRSHLLAANPVLSV